MRGIAPPAEILFRNAPLLMTHDSATGYVGDLDPLKEPTKTQWLSLLGQLECGVRAFDLRLVAAYEDFRQLHYHHTGAGGWGWKSDQMVSDTVPSLIDWSRAHPDELVVLVVSHCAATKGPVTVGALAPIGWKDISCTQDDVVEAFQNLGVKVQTSCDVLNTWTLDQALEFATMDKGGKMLMIPGEGGCVEPNYNDQITSIGQVEGYVDDTMAKAPSIGRPFQVQSLIQQEGLSVPVSAELNKDVYEWVTTSDLYDGVNFLEINLACAYATSISSALGANITSESANSCIQLCETACKKKGACEQ